MHPDQWRKQAMQGKSSISPEEMLKRRAQAERFYQEQGMTPNADTLADHELFIQGKMTLEEYQQYLVTKHAPKTDNG